MKKSNIVLTGFMGTGKSSAGKLIAKKLNMDYFDIDENIEILLGMKIINIFKKFGETRFRAEEKAMVKKAAGLENTVISTGGGVVLDPDNINILRTNGVIICLKTAPEIIYERVSKNTKRPLVAGATLEDIKKRLEDRREYYENADFFVDTGEKSLNEVVENVIAIIKTADGLEK